MGLPLVWLLENSKRMKNLMKTCLPWPSWSSEDFALACASPSCFSMGTGKD